MCLARSVVHGLFGDLRRSELAAEAFGVGGVGVVEGDDAVAEDEITGNDNSGAMPTGCHDE
ncbi:hypothetical protein [Streptomyces sp. NPDC059452]|uniref:hypothetical protein n=1 Tax=Streptomyces sp. NPDC059452 TaxID=3346835 RepID=UPI0036C15772